MRVARAFGTRRERSGASSRTAGTLRVAFSLAALAFAGGTAAPTAHAQRWSAEAHVGRLDFLAGAAAVPPATSVSLGLRRDSPTGWLRLAGGLPLGEEDPLWAAAELAQRPGIARGAWFFGIDVAAQGFLQRYSTTVVEEVGLPIGGIPELGGLRTHEETVHGSGIAGEVVPVAALRRGAVGIEAGAGLSWYHSSLGESELSRLARLAHLRLALAPVSPFALTGELRGVGVDGANYAYAGVQATYRRGPAAVWASAGRWFHADSAGTPWAAGASLLIGSRMELTAYARHDPFDPVQQSAPRRSWGIGTRLLLAAPPAPPRPVPAAYRGGRATIALPTAAVKGAPRIAGDFNGWTPVPMTREGDHWTYTVALAPGVYEYAFVGADGEWFVPESVPGRRDDGMGGYVAILVVEEADP